MFWTQLQLQWGDNNNGKKKKGGENEGLSVLVHIDTPNNYDLGNDDAKSKAKANSTSRSGRRRRRSIEENHDRIDLTHPQDSAHTHNPQFDPNRDRVPHKFSATVPAPRSRLGSAKVYEHGNESNTLSLSPFASTNSTPVRNNTKTHMIQKHENGRRGAKADANTSTANEFCDLQLQFPELNKRNSSNGEHETNAHTPPMTPPRTLSRRPNMNRSESAAKRFTSFARRRLGSAPSSNGSNGGNSEGGSNSGSGQIYHSRTNSFDYYDGDDGSSSSTRSASSSRTSGSTVVEDYRSMRIKIGKKDGIITFVDEKSHDDGNCKNSADAMSTSDNTKLIAENRSENRNESPQSNVPLHMNKIGIDRADSLPKDQETKYNDDISNHDLYVPSFGGEEFELIPTKNQTHIDHQQKEFHQTRKACLEAAAEAYKKASLEVPDMILAQINDNRNQLRKNRHANKVNDDAESSTNINVNLTTQIMNDAKITEERSERGARSSSGPQNSFLERIKLCKTDEIHVAPCQCALRLVGMRELPSVTDTSDESHEFAEEDASSQSLDNNSSSIFGSSLLGGSSKPIVHVRTASVVISEKQSLDSKLVRTSSAQASSTFVPKRSKGRVKAKAGVDTEGAEKQTNQKTKKRLDHSRTESNLFTSLGYHEITLICNQNQNDHDSALDGSDGATTDFLRWDAITIRCSSHDELDILIKSLKDSSRAKVVPFSSNPKERLRRLRDERKKKSKNRSIGRSIMLPPMGESMMEGKRGIMLCEGVLGRSLVEAGDEGGSSTNPQDDFSSESKDAKALQMDASGNKKKVIKVREKRKPWDFNFNKKEYCEVCDLTFTLLTRRHHCRECERSICGHCSTVLMVKGCDEKRYCNRCASSILQKQSEALKGKLRMNKYVPTIPGKVNQACLPLGVGQGGRLPYWKSYLKPQLDKRPAVGRLTVEILGAIALPSVDMLNGKVDPYVRATITGYDRDMKWTLRQWLKSNRYSLCSRFCTATLSPQWIGKGQKGGELLTLPIISTAGAVLRLEVLHYNVLTNDRSKDAVLGTVEIPLSDLPNANLRPPGTFDGFCDRWYRLIPSGEIDSNSIMLSKPIESADLKANKSGGNRKVGLQSLEEVGKRAQALAIAPIEWIASAIKLDLPAKRAEAIFKEHKERSMIHVRIKMNASLFGDIISHAWFPPVRPRPLMPPYDPEILLSRILIVGKRTAPYRKIIKFIEFCIKWKHEPIVCVKAYLVFAIHLLIFPYLLPVFHVYLLIFLIRQSFQMKIDDETDALQSSLHCIDSGDDEPSRLDCVEEEGYEPANKSLQTQRGTDKTKSRSKDSSDKTKSEIQSSPSLQDLNYSRESMKRQRGANAKPMCPPSSSHESLENAVDKKAIGTTATTEEEATKLNAGVHWIAKRLGDNKGLEVLQFKLGNLAKDLRNVNSVWDGTNPILTRAAIIYLVISFFLHFLVSQRLLWLLGTATFYFSQSPFVILTVRFMFGFWRGIAKATRRQQLLDAEISAISCA